MAKKPKKSKTPKKPPSKRSTAQRKPTSKRSSKPKLLSGGNPQIAKAYGDAPVQAYIAAVPDWKRDVCARLDAIITRTIPRVKKAVKWNSPFYGMQEGSWFASFHVYTKFVRVTFFKGAALDPRPTGKSKYPTIRYYDVREGELDAAQFRNWVKQASKLPGQKM